MIVRKIILCTLLIVFGTSKEAFWNWTKSEEFRLAHKDAGKHKDLYLGSPDFEGFEKVLFNLD